MPMIARTNAAKHLVKTSSRIDFLLPVSQRHWICRGCTSLLIPGTTAKVRIEKVSVSPLAWNVGQSNVSAVGQSIIGGGKISDIPERIKRHAMDRDFQPSVRIGKTGITPNIVEEIRAQLKKRKLVKIKINKGIYERDSRT